MKLYIDTSDREKIIVGLDDEKHESVAKERASQMLLPFIEELLTKNKKTFKDLTEIEVNTGPGSFTGLRVGVSVANALGWSLGIPVNGQKVLEGKPLQITYS